MTSVMPRKKIPLPTQADVDAARPVAKKLLEKARAFIVLDHPFFASIMLKHPFTENNKIPTLAVTGGGQIYYNPVFLAQWTPDQVVFAVAHEILHYASGHSHRRGTRDPKKWNIAGDMWINDTLEKAGVGTQIPGCIHVPGSAEKTVEDIYAGFPPDEDEGGGEQGGQGGGSTGQTGDCGGDGDEDGDNDPIGDDIQDGENKDTAEEEAQRKLDVSEAAQVAKIKGKMPGVLQKFAEQTVESRTPWYSVLERHMTDRVEEGTNWAKPNRRYAPDFYTPTRDSVGTLGEIAIQVDISGSVSRQEIRHYNGHLKRIVEQCRPTKVHVLYTDTEVQRHDEFDRPEDMEIGFYSGGGTHMPAGFKYLQDKGIEPTVCVTLTDGYTGWDTEPPFPTVHCISSKDQKAPYGHNVHFDLND